MDVKKWIAGVMAWLATIATFVIAFAPALSGPTTFDQDGALSVVQSLAVIWATYYAAVNIRALTRSEERETTPLLEFAVDRVQVEPGQPYSRMRLTIANLGRGGAAGVSALIHVSEPDGVAALEVLLPRSFIIAQQTFEAIIDDSDERRVLDAGGSFSVTLYYRDASKRRYTVTRSYDMTVYGDFVLRDAPPPQVVHSIATSSLARLVGRR